VTVPDRFVLRVPVWISVRSRPLDQGGTTARSLAGRSSRWTTCCARRKSTRCSRTTFRRTARSRRGARRRLIPFHRRSARVIRACPKGRLFFWRAVAGYRSPKRLFRGAKPTSPSSARGRRFEASRGWIEHVRAGSGERSRLRRGHRGCRRPPRSFHVACGLRRMSLGRKILRLERGAPQSLGHSAWGDASVSARALRPQARSACSRRFHTGAARSLCEGGETKLRMDLERAVSEVGAVG